MENIEYIGANNGADIGSVLADFRQKQAYFRPAERLLSWYDRNARVLPWREHPDPYWIWVSEIMLQQTRLNVVIPYFHRFIDSLPDIPALAKAEETLLLKLWEGLGYYSRVRNMQKAARVIVECHGGKLPASYSALLELPGIGEYTAGAIASTAYRIPVPAVDGNVLRVMARLLCCREDVRQPAIKKRLRALVGEILPEKRPGDFNQAMMDLGATVCLPNTVPHCENCPLRIMCAGYQDGAPSRLPIKSFPKKRPVQKKTVLVLLSAGRVLLHRRPDSGLLAGLWEYPNVDGWLDEKEVNALLNQWGICPLAIEKTESARHIFSHVEWHMQGYLVYTADFRPTRDTVWADENAVREEYPLPGAFKYFTRNLALWFSKSRID